MNVSGEREFAAPRDIVWRVLNDPASMAKTMPGVESFDIHDDRHWTANVKIPLGLGGLKMKVDMEKIEEREPEFARRKGTDDLEGRPEPDGGTPARRRPRLPWGGGAPAADPGTVVLEEAEHAAAAEPAPALEELVPSPSASAEAKRERRRQRRRARPHGRAR